jgi:hypothetical protein
VKSTSASLLAEQSSSQVSTQRSVLQQLSQQKKVLHKSLDQEVYLSISLSRTKLFTSLYKQQNYSSSHNEPRSPKSEPSIRVSTNTSGPEANHQQCQSQGLLVPSLLLFEVGQLGVRPPLQASTSCQSPQCIQPAVYNVHRVTSWPSRRAPTRISYTATKQETQSPRSTAHTSHHERSCALVAAELGEGDISQCTEVTISQAAAAL